MYDSDNNNNPCNPCNPDGHKNAPGADVERAYEPSQHDGTRVGPGWGPPLAPSAPRGREVKEREREERCDATHM